MTESRRYALGAQLDIEQILLEAQHRWLRPAEICEILQNYQKFRIAAEPPTKPPSGSLFLFDRKVLRYFRKDGHNWRKKKDGKTVKEAHERLKAGSVDVLHCYYAHGEDDENFQRRSYWLLEEEHSHIVLVHYREVKGNRTGYNRIREAGEAIPNIQETEDDVPNSEVNSTSTSKFHSYDYQVTSQITDAASLNSLQASEYEDAESAYSHQSSSGFHTFLELQPPVLQKAEGGPSIPYYSGSTSNGYQGQFSAVPDIGFTSIGQAEKDQKTTGAGTGGGLSYIPEGFLDFPSSGNVLDNRNAEYESLNFQASLSANEHSTMNVMPGGTNDMFGQILTDSLGKTQDSDDHAGSLEKWQASEGNSSLWPMDHKWPLQSAHNLSTSFNEVNKVELQNSSETFDMLKSPLQNDLQVHLRGADSGISAKSAMNANLGIEGKAEYSTLRQPLLEGVLKGSLKKLDSFDRWMTKELGDVNESHLQSSSGSYWHTVGDNDGLDDSNIAPQVDAYMMSPSISQDQLFSIIDFSPNWTYSGSDMKVLIIGRFLKSQQELEKYRWACMFGEVEVPAEVIANGVLRCHTPDHEAGRVPFYVTCSNRLACSEVREFEFRVRIVQDEDVASLSSGIVDESNLLTRFGKLLISGSHNYQNPVPATMVKLSGLCSKIESLLKDDDCEWEGMLNLSSEKFSSEKFSMEKAKNQLLQKLLKNHLFLWLLRKAAEGGKGPNVLDEGGQGLLHHAAALGYDWALFPIIAGGVSVNFRDVNGWTALHWAASFGREQTVALLISLGANPGALIDPTLKYPTGRTAADLASDYGHKGIAGYLAESALSSHLSLLEVKDDKDGFHGEVSGSNIVQTASERTATPIADGDLSGLSLKDSLAALRNATQAHARIHQVFRVQSFQRKLKEEYGSGLIMSDERALSLLSGKSKRTGRHDEPLHAAATQIQNKFRSWKRQKELIQRVTKIQALVRGHQVRKKYRSIIWSVGILEKVILRWRRKGSGLRGFKPEARPEGTSTEGGSSKEDDYDFLKEGRKQTDDRFQKALARVKSMVQYPEAREQYRRLLNVVSEMQETKAVYDRALSNSDEAADFDEDLIDLDALLADDPLMSEAS